MKDRSFANALIMAALFMSSCSPVVAPQEPKAKRAKDSPTATQTFIPDIQDLPAATPQSVVKVAEINKVPDSKPQAPNLDEFLTSNEAETVMVAHSLGVDDPSNMCGPLAVAILKKMGFLPDYTAAKSYWIFNPEEKSERERLFPSDKFDYIRVMEPVNRYDFSKNPFQVGDFVFLSGGSFGHMLAVTEIDDQGRAYTITNIKQYDGTFKIEKIMLYDPNIPVDPKATLYYDPKKPDEPYFNNGWAILSPHGRTGVNFYIWRKH